MNLVSIDFWLGACYGADMAELCQSAGHLPAHLFLRMEVVYAAWRDDTMHWPALAVA